MDHIKVCTIHVQIVPKFVTVVRYVIVSVFKQLLNLLASCSALRITRIGETVAVRRQGVQRSCLSLIMRITSVFSVPCNAVKNPLPNPLRTPRGSIGCHRRTYLV